MFLSYCFTESISISNLTCNCKIINIFVIIRIIYSRSRRNEQVVEISDKYYVKFIVFLEHVEAHTGGEDSDSMGNDVADSLAKRASKKAIKLKLSTLKETNQRHQPSGSKTNQKYQPSGSKTNMRRPIAVKNNKSSIVVELIKSKN